MNNETRIVEIFRTFIEKALLPQIKRTDGNIQEWNRFNALLNNQGLNLNQLQNYVDSLPPFPFERKEIPNATRKRQDNRSYNEHVESFSANKTFGGERSKHIVSGLRNTENDNHRLDPKGEGYKETPQSKQYSQGKQYSSGRSDSFRREVPNSMQNLGGSPQSLYQPVNVLSSLERLLKGLMENQLKLEMLQGKGS